MTAQDIIDILGLTPLEPEGGKVAETYHGPLDANGEMLGSAIYYFLEGDEVSHLHRLSGDETYHFYLGDPVELLELVPDGTFRVTKLGTDLLSGERPQHTVPAGHWQGSRLAAGGKYALMGTSMCPGYSDSSYTHGSRDELLSCWPAAAELIKALS